MLRKDVLGTFRNTQYTHDIREVRSEENWRERQGNDEHLHKEILMVGAALGLC